MIESEGELTGARLDAGDPLPFRCHPGLACFNSCCRDKRLTLLPYDVLRLARALGRGSDAFLAERAVLEIEPGSGWPTLRIALEDDGRCPFVGAAGCRVYADRPTCCRIYPLARALRLGGGGAIEETFVREDTGARCLGFGGPATSTVREWTRDQGLDPYREANERAARLFLDPRRSRPLGLSGDEIHAVVMGLYNLDVFRALVARPGFAARSGLDPAAVDGALASSEALLDLGLEWVARRLFG